MKKLLLASLILSSFACYASVSRGPGDTYLVDSHGAPINTTNPNEKLPKRVNFMPESQARQATGFKTSSPLAIY